MIIAIDGTTSSGKGTLAKRLAAWCGLPHLDTGLLYRAVAAKAIEAGIDPTDSAACARLAEGVDLSEFAEAELRGSKIGAVASLVASYRPVRQALFDMQQGFARQPSGAVLDGRDIGTVIAPEAELKFWVDAALAVRASRRWRELAGLGEAISEADVIAQLKERDARDAGRTTAPMKAAIDAHQIDTTAMTPDEVFDWALKILEKR